MADPASDRAKVGQTEGNPCFPEEVHVGVGLCSVGEFPEFGVIRVTDPLIRMEKKLLKNSG